MLRHALVAGPVNTRPDGEMVLFDKTQAPGRLKFPCRVMLPDEVSIIWLLALALNGAVTCTGGIRCGWMSVGIRICTATKMTSVTAIAGSVRRISTPSRDAERECERGVADRRYAGCAEERGCEPLERVPGLLGGLIERAGPPADHQAEQSGSGHGGQADEAELDRDPASAGDALVPGQPEGAALKLAGDQWRAPEDADQRGHGIQQDDAAVEDQPGRAALHLVDEVARVRAAAGATGCQPAAVEQRSQVRSGDRQGDRHRDQRGACHDGLDAELTPAQPDHRVPSSIGRAEAAFALPI